MKIYQYDGSMPGLLCAFSRALEVNSENAIFAKANESELELFSSDIIPIETSPQDADKLIAKLNDISTELSRSISLCFLSEINGIENYLYFTIRESLKRNISTLKWLNNEKIKKVNDAVKKVTKEIHRFKGILRFSQLSDNSYLANFAPDHNIIIPLANHFKNRLASGKWIIRDTKRNIAIAYEKSQLSILDEEEIQKLDFAIFANNEVEIRTLWQGFFKSIAIPERKNLKLQKQFIPKRYWSYLTEKNLQS